MLPPASVGREASQPQLGFAQVEMAEAESPVVFGIGVQLLAHYSTLSRFQMYFWLELTMELSLIFEVVVRNVVVW